MKHWVDQRVALLTQHGKERVIAPVLEPALGCVVQHVDHFDTDQLGTFTREVRRPGSQVQAAREKARMGMTLSGLPVGMASEGSFGPDPHAGLFPWNVEVLIWLDDRLGIEVVGIAQGPARSGHLQTADWAAVERFAHHEGFPDHQLVIRPQDQDDPRIIKGIADWPSLRAGFDTCASQASNGQVFVELDLRAFANPTRMARIGEAALDLVQRLQSTCPACSQPGYWISQHIAGLPCLACRAPTRTYASQEWACVSCSYRHIQRRTDLLFADPQHCALCNP